MTVPLRIDVILYPPVGDQRQCIYQISRVGSWTIFQEGIWVSADPLQAQLEAVSYAFARLRLKGELKIFGNLESVHFLERERVAEVVLSDEGGG